VVRELIAKGRVVRPSPGLVAISLTPQVAYVNDLPVERGALVIRVDAAGPAAMAGIEPGDVLTAVGGKSIRDLHHLHDELALHRIGETVDVTVWRAGRTVALRLVLEAEL
jgi:S1-C subfamily serine protease